MAVTMKLRAEDLTRLQNMLAHISGGFQKALSRASNRVANQGRTEVSASIREKVNIQKNKLDKKVLHVKKVGKTSHQLTLEATQRLPLKYFGAKQSEQGVSYKIPKNGSRQIALSAFGPLIPRLGNQVFKRVEKGKPPKRYKSRNKKQGKRFDNLPIIPLFGISPWGTFIVNKMLEPTKEKLAIAFARRVTHEAKFLIEEAAKKKG